jgi:hypothetical protein
MGYIAGRGRRVSETYPERSPSSGSPASIPPLSDLWFVDVDTTVPAPDQTGSIAAPYGSLQIAFDAGHFRIALFGNDVGAVVPIGVNFVLLTTLDQTASTDSLTLPDNCLLICNLVAVGTLIMGANGNVFTNKGIGTTTMGAAGLIVASGPGAVSFGGSGADQVAFNDMTIGVGGAFNATNAVLSLGGTIVADGVGLFGCQCRGDVTAGSIDAQNSAFTGGTYTTTGPVSLQDVKCDAGVAFDNALGQAFNLDGFTNYWIKTNAVALTNVGEKVITDDLVP